MWFVTTHLRFPKTSQVSKYECAILLFDTPHDLADQVVEVSRIHLGIHFPVSDVFPSFSHAWIFAWYL